MPHTALSYIAYTVAQSVRKTCTADIAASLGAVLVRLCCVDTQHLCADSSRHSRKNRETSATHRAITCHYHERCRSITGRACRAARLRLRARAGRTGLEGGSRYGKWELRH